MAIVFCNTSTKREWTECQDRVYSDSFILKHRNSLINLFSYKYPFISTNDEKIIKLSFNSDEYYWSTRSQIFILSEKNHVPKKITHKMIDKFFKKFEIDFIDNLDESLLGLLYPAVDGDFLECIFKDKIQFDLFIKILSEECTEKNIEYKKVDETEFMNINWFLNEDLNK